MNILISFHSDYGHTEKMAFAIAAGCQASFPDACIKTLTAEQTQLADFEHADIIFLGTPVHMGSMAWGMKKLLDSTSKLWMEELLEGKVGGVFACSGGLGGAGGGIEQTLISLHSLLLEHGMTAVGFPKSLLGYADAGIQWGVAARTSNHEGMPEAISEQALTACRSYAAHVCHIADKLR
ncbi:MAG: flavodoxin domain-containing protein [Mariprofundaceae bacterium]|nr:flavodoxin domain-containing protein [Mariprofundaceae bacterium]